jgi:hypothetical protein
MDSTNSLAIGTAVESRTAARAGASPWLVPLFGGTLFVSAFLLFLVQPMIAKMVLPMLGGAPMVWNACMVFFQLTLLAGYAYAHGATTWLTGRTQIMFHAALLLVPLAVLPVLIRADAAAPPAGNPILWLLVLLAFTIGLPFFVLSTSASVLQHWFSRTDHPAARDPYFLYTASNLGSFLALAAYPVLVEPQLTVREQSTLWTAGYLAFIALAACCAVATWRHAGRSPADRLDAGVDRTTDERSRATDVSVIRRARWVMLAFIPSSLMLAVTSYLSTDIAAVPLLWIVPLGLYLLTFVLAFSASAERARAISRKALPLLVVPLALLMSTGATTVLSLVFSLHLLAFVAAALHCHGSLAEDRPGAAALTEFYLLVSFGGMLGGLFNSLVAPVIFDGILEYPLVLSLACLFLPGPTGAASPRDKWLDVVIPAGVGVATAVIAQQVGGDAALRVLLAGVAVPAIFTFAQRRRPIRFGLSVAALIFAGLMFGGTARQALYAERTFFGVYRVNQFRDGDYRVLAHGTTLHGMQALRGPEIGEPLTYFHRTGPFGQAFSLLPQAQHGRHIAVIGLGVGTLGAYAGPHQQFTFFEIDPAVERIARNPDYFNFLERCAERCHVVIGDARLSLARTSANEPYDVLVLDAFSSDSIPIHLITREAVALYLSKLAPNGALIFHISNRHLDLEPVVANLAAAHGLIAYGQFDTPAKDWPKSKSSSDWVVMARSRAELGGIVGDPRWTELKASAAGPLWTDDFSNILSVLKRR